MVPLLFSAALFISALLLFSIQPLVAKMLLPYLGGSPAVWNTCMVFFQVMLLSGYVFAHVVPRKIGVRRHAVLHLALLIVAALVLPIAVSAKAIELLPSSALAAPFWLLATLLITVGLPFFVLSTNAPLLQSWFSHTAHTRAGDPYFLYAASNVGSLLALLGYPLLLEPNLKLQEQSLLWTTAYGVGFALVLICAVVFMRAVPTVEVRSAINSIVDSDSNSSLSWDRRLKWVRLALVPSSLMLGVTSYISIDLAPVPLLWVVPLSIYLLSFILQFSRGKAHTWWWGRYLVPLLALPVVLTLATGANQPQWIGLSVHLAFFFAACMLCHGELANDRPGRHHLTEFYLWLSVGGALGGLFNALVAPLLFKSIIEYPLMVVIACLLRAGKERADKWDLATPLIIFVLLCGVLHKMKQINVDWHVFLIPFAASLLVAYFFVERRVRFGLAMLSVLIAGALFPSEPFKTTHIERNFFGVLRVMSNEPESFHLLMHGTTLHGRQFADPARSCQPLGYYHKTGPFGSIASTLAEQIGPRVAVVGLGAGATAAYSTVGQEWTFYEIDPAVVKIARNPAFFSYLDGCSRSPIKYVLGDGRLRLKEAPDNYYSLIALDAFSSDAIPLHLLTREAVGMYLSKLAGGGMLAFHITNRHVDLSLALGSVARTYGLTALIMRDMNVTQEEARAGKDGSVWIVMARRPEDLKRLAEDSRWETLTAPENFRVWTDDFSNIFSVLWR